MLVIVEGGRVEHDEFLGPEPTQVRPQLKLGWVRSIQAIATRESRVSFDHIVPIVPHDLGELIPDAVPQPLLASARRLIESDARFARVTPKLGQWLLGQLAARSDNAVAFRRLMTYVERPTHYRNAVALQDDAIKLALRTFGVPDAAASTLAYGSRSTALAGVRLQEDVVIEHDARWLPGWSMGFSDVTGRAVFVSGNEELQIFTANKQPLERLFGVDLIYLNET